VGSPIRHHVDALRAFLQLRSDSSIGGRESSVVDGPDRLLNFLRGHWRDQNRINNTDEGKEKILNARLSLHSKNKMFDALHHVQETLNFSEAVEGLIPSVDSGEDRKGELASLYNDVLKKELGPRGRPRKLSGFRSTVREGDSLKEGGLSSAALDQLDKEFSDSNKFERDDDCASMLEGSIFYGDSSSSPLMNSDFVIGSEEQLEKLVEHQRMLHCLLVFDVWHDFLASPMGAKLPELLAASPSKADQNLSEQIAFCIGSLPTNTDEWVRLFISAVQDLESVGVCICDMSMPGAPIVHVNAGFRQISGYESEEAVGRSCRFMQGPASDPDSVATIRKAMRLGTRAHVRLINYRADGSPFNNMITFRPIFDREGHMIFIVALNTEVTDSFSKMKPMLQQVHRLSEFIPEQIALPSPASVRQRLSLVQHATLASRCEELAEEPAEEQILMPKSSRQRMQTATEKAVLLAKKRIADFHVKKASKTDEAEPEMAVKSEPKPSVPKRSDSVMQKLAKAAVERKRAEEEEKAERAAAEEARQAEQSERVRLAKVTAMKRSQEYKAKMAEEARLKEAQKLAKQGLATQSGIARGVNKMAGRLIEERRQGGQELSPPGALVLTALAPERQYSSLDELAAPHQLSERRLSLSGALQPPQLPPLARERRRSLPDSSHGETLARERRYSSHSEASLHSEGSFMTTRSTSVGQMRQPRHAAAQTAPLPRRQCASGSPDMSSLRMAIHHSSPLRPEADGMQRSLSVPLPPMDDTAQAPAVERPWSGSGSPAESSRGTLEVAESNSPRPQSTSRRSLARAYLPSASAPQLQTAVPRGMGLAPMMTASPHRNHRPRRAWNEEPFPLDRSVIYDLKAAEPEPSGFDYA